MPLFLLAACNGPRGTAPPEPAPPAAPEYLGEAVPTTIRPAPPALDLRALERRIHARVNAVRQAHGLAPLTWSAPLSRVARRHSRDMAARRFFRHINLEGQNADERAGAVERVCTDWIGENLFMTDAYVSYRDIRRYRNDELVDVERVYRWKTPQRLARQVVEQWMESPGHRRNLLHPGYTAEGLGVARTGHALYVTENFC